METNPNTKSAFDVARAMFDFGDAFESDPESAIREFQALLLDEQACRDRIAFLEGVRLGREDAAGLQSSSDEFAREIRLVGAGRTIAAFREGQLKKDRLCALALDPQALWSAHRALLGDTVDGAEKGEPELAAGQAGTIRQTADLPTPPFTSADVTTSVASPKNKPAAPDSPRESKPADEE